MMLAGQDEYLANAYIIGRDGGVPLVYSDHNESAGAYPRQGSLGRVVERYDIVPDDRVPQRRSWHRQRCIYEADGFLVLARGDKGIVAINKTEDWQSPTIWTWGLRQGRYRCQISQYEMNLQGDMFTFAIPAGQAQMWLYADM